MVLISSIALDDALQTLREDSFGLRIGWLSADTQELLDIANRVLVEYLDKRCHRHVGSFIESAVFATNSRRSQETYGAEPHHPHIHVSNDFALLARAAAAGVRVFR